MGNANEGSSYGTETIRRETTRKEALRKEALRGEALRGGAVWRETFRRVANWR
jgi:hypothetical protein